MCTNAQIGRGMDSHEGAFQEGRHERGRHRERGRSCIERIGFARCVGDELYLVGRSGSRITAMDRGVLRRVRSGSHRASRGYGDGGVQNRV